MGWDNLIKKRTGLSFSAAVICYALSFLLYSSCYGVEFESHSESGLRQEIITSTLDFYEKEISVRERVREELVGPPEEGLRIRHYFSVETAEIYDDNIYNDEDNEEGDFITKITPVFRLDVLSEKLFFTSSHKLSMLHYLDMDDQWFDYSTGGLLTYKCSPRIQFAVGNQYERINSLTQIKGTDLVIKDHTTSRSDYNRFYIRGRYDLARAGNNLWLQYNNNAAGIRLHGRNNNIHTTMEEVGLGLTHSFTRRASVSPAYTFRMYKDRSNKLQDFHANGLKLQFDYMLANVLKTKGSVGWEYRDFKKRGRSEGTPRIAFGITSLFSPRTTVEMDYVYDRMSSYSSTASYSQNRFGAGIYHKFTPLLRGFLAGTYDAVEYKNIQNDDIFSLGLGLDFNLGRQLTTSLEYRYSEKNSTVDSLEYVDNVYIVRVKSVLW